MNRCADLEARAADADPDRVYQQLLSKPNNDDNATQKLRAAQRAGLAFRAALRNVLFPGRDGDDQRNNGPASQDAKRKRAM